MERLIITLVLCCFVNHGAIAGTMVIRHSLIQTSDDPRPGFFVELLRLALDKTRESHGDYQLIPVVLNKVPQRLNKLVKTEQLIDITVSIATKELYKDLLPIRIPLLKGLIGYRLLLINQQDQEKFQSIQNIEDLKHLTVGQSKGWPDTLILRDNGIKVVTSSEYQHLFSMLRKKRFDSFPRSIVEISDELNLHDDFAIADNIALYYPAAFNFFVNNNNIELAERLDLGLRIAIQDGSYDKMLMQTERFRWALEQLKNTDRKVFTLKNAFLPDDVSLLDKNLWYFPNLN